MYVEAADGLRVPMEEHPRRYIEETPVHVPDTAYYRRRMADGDLIALPEPDSVNEEARRGKR